MGLNLEDGNLLPNVKTGLVLGFGLVLLFGLVLPGFGLVLLFGLATWRLGILSLMARLVLYLRLVWFGISIWFGYLEAGNLVPDGKVWNPLTGHILHKLDHIVPVKRRNKESNKNKLWGLIPRS